MLTTANGSSTSPFAILGISGTISDFQIDYGTTLNITGLSNYASADNLLYYPTQPYIDFSGISFVTLGGGSFNIGNGPPYAIVSSILNPGGYFPSGPYTTINLQISQTPLPPAWTMMLIGLAGFGFAAYRLKSNRQRGWLPDCDRQIGSVKPPSGVARCGIGTKTRDVSAQDASDPEAFPKW